MYCFIVQSPPEVHANAAETLCAITRNTPSPLATKLSSPRSVGLQLILLLKALFSLGFFPDDVNFDWISCSTSFTCSFVSRIFCHALEDSQSKSALVHSLTVCISLLDSKRSIPSFMMYSFRSQHVYESPMHVSPDTIDAMLPKLGKFLFAKNFIWFWIAKYLLDTFLPFRSIQSFLKESGW